MVFLYAGLSGAMFQGLEQRVHNQMLVKFRSIVVISITVRP